MLLSPATSRTTAHAAWPRLYDRRLLRRRRRPCRPGHRQNHLCARLSCELQGKQQCPGPGDVHHHAEGAGHRRLVMATGPMSSATDAFGLGDLLNEQRQDETEEQKRRRFMLQQMREAMNPLGASSTLAPMRGRSPLGY